MNEPSQYMSENNHTLLSSYYQKAYRLIRSYSHTTLVVFNELYEHLYSKWDDVMLEPDYYNVMVDWHLYDWQVCDYVRVYSKMILLFLKLFG